MAAGGIGPPLKHWHILVFCKQAELWYLLCSSLSFCLHASLHSLIVHGFRMMKKFPSAVPGKVAMKKNPSKRNAIVQRCDLFDLPNSILCSNLMKLIMNISGRKIKSYQCIFHLLAICHWYLYTKITRSYGRWISCN